MDTRRQCCLAAGALWALLPVVCGAGPTGPAVSLVSNVVSVGAGQATATTTFKLRVDDSAHSEVTCKDGLTVVDGGTPDPPRETLVFTIADVAGTPSSRMCLVTATVAGLPFNVAQPRQLLVTWQKVSTTLEYTLTNRSEIPFTWTLKAPPTLRLNDGDAIPITLLTGARGATGVRLASVSLVEQSRKHSLAPLGFRLCTTAADPCVAPSNIAAGEPATLWLRPEGNAARAGHFSGSAIITCAEKPEGELVVLDVYESRGWSWFLGALAIFAGVGIAWLISTWGRSRFNRDQLLLPVVVLRERVATLEATLARAPPELNGKLPLTTAELQSLLQDLSEESLTTANLLPAVVASAFTGPGQTLGDFRQFVDKTDQRIAVLAAVVNSGLSVAWDQLASGAPPSAIDSVVTAVGAIDTLVVVRGPAPALTFVMTGIGKALLTLRDEFAAQQTTARAGARALTVQPATAYTRLTLEMRFISKAVWTATLLGTAVVGVFALVVPNLGFGLASDYVGCVLWGLGVPMGVQTLNQLSSGSVTASLGVSAAK